MRLAFLGTPEIAVPPLEALVADGHDVAMVVTRPDRRRGRGTDTSPSPVSMAASALGLDVRHVVDDVLDVDAELGVVVAFGQLIKPHVLARLPMINLHFSLLPRWRGAAPVERAILAGDDETGVCLMQVAEGLDTGDVHACVAVPIGARETAAELRRKLVTAGTALLVSQLRDGLDSPTPQVGEPSYAAKITPEELRLDWARPAVELDRLVRVGGAWTMWRGSRIKVIEAEILDDRLAPTVVQPEGRRPMTFDDWRRGARLADGEWFA
ncbi:MAG TPA: methionyl-tRNA formyltransferase [Ilumatobacteraceae bacterium]|nr:methionyl-tRNA formyltransferase [Ilumatobacteraceae bacterium]